MGINQTALSDSKQTNNKVLQVELRVIYSVLFRVKVENAIEQLLLSLNKTLVFMFCNKIIDEYIMDGPIDEKTQATILEFFEGSEVHIMNPAGKVSYIYVNCESDGINHLTVCKGMILQNRGQLMAMYQLKNVQYYSVLVYGKKYLDQLLLMLNDEFEFEKLASKEVSLMSLKGDEPYVKMNRILDELTELQLSILKSSIEQGYYRNPRKVTLQEIAKDLGKSNSTVEKIFRAAENVVMDVVVPELYKYIQTSSSIENKST